MALYCFGSCTGPGLAHTFRLAVGGDSPTVGAAATTGGGRLAAASCMDGIVDSTCYLKESTG